MAEEPSAKHPHSEMFDHTTKLHGIEVPGEKLDYTIKLKDVQVHGREPLEVVCTSNPDEADEMIRRLRMRAGVLLERIIGVDVEYTREDEPPRRATVMQLCVEDLCLVHHITAAKERPKCLNELLMEKKLYTCAGFIIEGDKQMLKSSGLEINPNKYIDIQRKWGVPYSGKEYDSLANVASRVIHEFYKNTKKKINNEEDHKLWGINPLPEKLIKYAAIDAYATYESWKQIITIKKGLDRAKKEEENFGNPYA